ncbi:hypothetical protein THAR02_11454 [Trichoderma harzianum]|uniref:Uncharacterized protein n=1 Tax=Trichoderma harzianum TaxID=5544 RepID=A0A0F9WTD1_TRIHA|nr:hypothetical protein THAR02_11454 [Trichoderma harzianum]
MAVYIPDPAKRRDRQPHGSVVAQLIPTWKREAHVAACNPLWNRCL